MKPIILFGAGVYAKKYKALLEYIDIDFDYFTDNDASKWGTSLYGKEIISPDELSKFHECQIIISSTHEVAIREQLTKMGLGEHILGLDGLYRLCESKMEAVDGGQKEAHEEKTIIVDMYEGIGWGGTELWAANLAQGLSALGRRTILLGGTEQLPLEKHYEKLVERVSDEDTIMHMVDLFEANLPCVFINNFAGCAFMAAIIIKRKYPDMIKIISVIHNDNKSLFDAHMMLKEYIDKVFCVSNEICGRMLRIYDYDKDRYFFKEQPIAVDDQWVRKVNKILPLRIGYAGRLVKQQKRTDKLVDFLECLEKLSFDYICQIAGEGECEAFIKEYVTEKHLEGKIQMHGRLPKSKMPEFWKAQDVFINISEYEGTSLSMLEAMAYGCVPVVTDVSGAKEFIVDGDNGYICKVGNLKEMANRVKELADNREKLENASRRCRDIIKQRCNPTEYMKYWIQELID